MASAAPLLCAGITTWSPLRRWKVGHGQKVGVIGLGDLGHMAVKFANAFGAEVDPDATPQFGLVAEEVAKVDPDLVARDAAGKPFTVRYDEVNAMLLNEFLKEHRTVEEQAAALSEVKSAASDRDSKIRRLKVTIAEQQKQIASLTESLKQQAAEVRKVSARLEAERRLIADK
jgi:phosphoribosylaminoimidazole carboxylase (NCAIR synthetase)